MNFLAAVDPPVATTSPQRPKVSKSFQVKSVCLEPIVASTRNGIFSMGRTGLFFREIDFLHLQKKHTLNRHWRMGQVLAVTIF